MPTGYTAAVVDGKVSEFSKFAMSCARAFGACIDMRDDPMDAEIPQEFKPSSYHQEQLDEAKSKLERLQNLHLEQARVEAQVDYDKAFADHTKYMNDLALENKRIDTMIEKVKAWVPPTSDHTELKDFMLGQLRISKHDPQYYSAFPKLQSGADWLQNQLTKAKRDVAYHTEELEKDVRRANERTLWVKRLRESLVND